MNKQNFNLKILFCIVIMLCVILLSIGFSAFSASMDISSISAIISPQKNIRITSLTVGNTENNATSSYDEYSSNGITSNISLPNSNSKVTYNIVVTNIGNIEMGILNITGLPSNLTYSIANYNLKNPLCDDNDSTNCKLGSTTTLEVTIGYTNNGYSSSNTNYLIALNFTFAEVFNITYNGFSSTSSLTAYIMQGDTETITFNNTTGIPYDVSITNAIGSYNSPNLTLSNPTGNVIINRYYQITYNLNNGNNSSSNPNKFLQTDNITLEEPTYSGYVFGGWYENSSFSGNAITSILNRNSDIVLYAKWLNTITYILNGGIQANNQVTSFDQSIPQNILDPTRNNYDFAGWYREEDFSGTKIISTNQLTGNSTLYANWAPIYTIDYTLNGGTQINNPVISFSSVNVQTLLNPLNTHDATFSGWYESSSFSGSVITTTSQLSSSTTLYAKWISGINNTEFDMTNNSFVASNVSGASLGTFTTNASYQYTQSIANTTINSIKVYITYRSGNKTASVTCRVSGSSTVINFNTGQSNTTAEGLITLSTPIPAGSSYTISCPQYSGDGNGNNRCRVNGFAFQINPNT